MNREKRIYSVILTEKELKLFSDWKEDYEKEKQEFEDHLNQKPDNSSWQANVRKNATKDGTMSRLKNSLLYFNNKDEYDKTLKHLREIPEDENYYRLSKGMRDKVDETINTLESNPYKSGEHDKALSLINNRLLYAGDAVRREDNLRESGYDDKYSSKRLENLLKKKIDAKDSYEIITKRSEKDKLYKKDYDGKLVKSSLPSELKRHYRDAKIVYESALDGHSLNKDAAIAAGVTASLVGGGIALRKHLKKKRQEKELAESKYKTSKKDKKNK